MEPKKPIPFLGTAVLLAVIVALTAGPASAGSFTAGPLTLVSGPSPFAGCTVGGYGSNYLNAEVEPRVAVNPANPYNIVAVWQQDPWSTEGAHGLVTGVSHDGGATWSRTFAHFSLCSGGTTANGGDFARASGPWVTFAVDGDAYQISQSLSADLSTSAILVSRSGDGGDTWSEPTTLIRDTTAFNFNAKGSITADPTDPTYVYAVWGRSNRPGENFKALRSAAINGDTMFSRTKNGGVSWETPRSITNIRAANLFTAGNQIVVLPNGTLVNVFELKGVGAKQSVISTVSLIRSTDRGATWSGVIDISSDQSVAVLDPDTGAEVRAGAGLPDVVVDPYTGALYVVWADGRFSDGAHDDIALSISTDVGATWSAPIKVNQTTNDAAAFTPSVNVAADGTVAVTYYDFRNNTAAPGVPTDYWVVHCHASCTYPSNWSETHVAGPFDIETAPVVGGYFLGDHQGLTSSGVTFMPFFIQANTGNTANRTDAFTTTVGP